MRFGAADYLWLLAVLPIFTVASWRIHVLKIRALQRFAGGRGFATRFTPEVSRNRRAVKLLLLYLTLLALPLALARPQWGTRLEPITRRGADVVLVLDTSLSMATEDLAPSRLGQAKHAVGSLLAGIEGDRVALVSFAGEAQLNCPLTVDHAAVRMFLDALDVESVTLPGTALVDATRAALGALRVREDTEDDRGRAIVLFSDGEDHAGGMDDLLEDLERLGVRIYAIGTGTTEGAPIPLHDASGVLTGYKKDREGRVVTTRLNESVLEDLALESGGLYYRATTGEIEIEEIVKALSTLSQGELGSEVRTRFEERFQLPLLVGLLALSIETILGDRRRPKAAGLPDRRVA